MAQQNRQFENSEQLYKSTSAKNTQVKTAVEWLVEQLIPKAFVTYDVTTHNAIQQAKQMEKMRMIDFALKMLKVDCSKTGTDILHDEAEEYYNETYGGL
jgi:tRNA A-37 threonylcarbamoyl transferase component Bud32